MTATKSWRGAEERAAEVIVEFKRGKVIEMGPSVDDFFEEDESVEDVIAAFEAGENFLITPPASGAGWCAPSP